MFVFLDVDGVLNQKREWVIPYSLNKDCLDNFSDCFKDVDAKIILISSWRIGFISPNNQRNLPQIKRLEEELSRRGLQIRGITNPDEKDRLRGIESFLCEHPGRYIIIDDDASEYSTKVSSLYLVNCEYGFSKKDIKKIGKILSW